MTKIKKIEYVLTGAVLALSISFLSCSATVRRFPLDEPLWEDTDRQPIAHVPEEYVSPNIWDKADLTVFEPLGRIFYLDYLVRLRWRCRI